MMQVKNCVVISHNQEAAFNMALEEAIYKKEEKNTKDKEINILLFWRNSPSIIIGYNQNPEDECDLEYTRKNHIPVVRRKSGGGAVYHDLGNLNFSFIQSTKYADREKNFDIIISALKAMGINATRSGRNDIFADTKKISGNAFYKGRTLNVHHGTLMIEVDISEMNKILKAKQKYYETDGISSVYSKVVNLKDINPKVTPEKTINKIIDLFQEKFNIDEKQIPLKNEEEYVNDIIFENLYKKNKSEEWIYGQLSSHDLKFKGIFPWGEADIRISSIKGKISDIQIYSNLMEYEKIENIKQIIHGKSIREIAELIEQKNLYDIEKDILELVVENAG